ncbi:hypothetical protein DVK02_16565, partial [Halobellus sp. Atlit-31R]
DLQLGVYAAPAYLAQAGTPAHPLELQDPRHRIVRYRWTKGLPYAMHRGEESVKIAGRSILTIDDGNGYLTAGLAGLGALWLPDYMAREHAANGALVRLFADWRIDPMPLYVAYAPNRYLGKALRVFIDWMAELMAVHAPRTRAWAPNFTVLIMRPGARHGWRAARACRRRRATWRRAVLSQPPTSRCAARSRR